MPELHHVVHTLAPIYRPDSRILILGSMPSPKSRSAGFYYAHPQNRFWRVMEALFQTTPLRDDQTRISFLTAYQIALWDVLESCDIIGADDGSIRNPVPNRLEIILEAAPVQMIFTTGGKAAQLYRKYCYPDTRREAVPLPSTSPANCRFYTFDRLLQSYEIIKECLKQEEE